MIKRKRSLLILLLAVVTSLFLFACNTEVTYTGPSPVPSPTPEAISIDPVDKQNSVPTTTPQIIYTVAVDDWQLNNQIEESDSNSASFSSQSSGAFRVATQSSAGSALGFSTGGAKYVNNFRENIKNDFLPLPTDVTYEGLYYDYFFDTGIKELCQKLFCPSYVSAISKDPFSEKEEYFLSVGLNSGIRQEDFTRKKLNLIIVLDISGSMEESFDRYYYDNVIAPSVTEEGESGVNWNKTKLQIAAESAVALIDHLNPEDSFGMVLFDNTAYLAKPLRKIGNTDVEAVKKHILELNTEGGTNLEAGMRLATKQFEQYLQADSDEIENRIIFLTDAQPNIGDTSESGLLGIVKSNADNKIHTTFIGIGVDFNTELIDSITKTRGANYYAVHSPEQFRNRMDDGFDYMVTPLVFNLNLTVDAPGFEIQKVYGSPEADEATTEILKVNTLFPSERIEEKTRGGLILIHLKKVSNDGVIKLTASYEDRQGVKNSSSATVEFEKNSGVYQNTGIRKGIVLARYASLLKNWMLEARKIKIRDNALALEPYLHSTEDYYNVGIPVVGIVQNLSQWERQSMELKISDDYKKLFNEFILYFEAEVDAIEDETMDMELKILQLLTEYSSSS